MRLRLFSIALGCALAVGCSDPSSPDPPADDTSAEDARFTPEEIQLLQSLALSSLGPPPPAHSNAVADDPRAADLGHRLFFDPGLSANGAVSCASCHRPELHFTDGRPTSTGLGRSLRNAPSVVAAAYSPFLFWDGRRDSLWSQALAPLETPAEMGASRLDVVRSVTKDPRYAADYAAIFGPPPDFGDRERYPPEARPFGSDAQRAAWQVLSPETRSHIDRAFSNIGKAIAAYERRLSPRPSRFDRFVERLAAGDEAGARGLLEARERAGLRLFLDAGRTQCLRCHNGPLLTNQAFHDVASGRLGKLPDLGRFLGIESLLINEFNCLGPYSDAPPEACEELRFVDRREAMRKSGAFKTPTLRDVARTAPYFHDGSLASLEAVIQHYREAPASRGSEITPLELSDAEAAQLVAFLHTLSSDAPDDDAWFVAPEHADF